MVMGEGRGEVGEEAEGRWWRNGFVTVIVRSAAIITSRGEEL
jgi:hypothetical protein